MLLTLPVLKIAAIDSALGRLNYESLSDQTLMEMLFDGLGAKDKWRLQDGNGNYADSCEWTLGWRMKVQCTDDRVKNIKVIDRTFRPKQFPFNFIPPLTEFFAVKDCGIQGTLDTSLLPVHLIKVDVTFNKLHGTIDVKAFPRTLKHIYIYVNAFSGSCALSELPSSVIIAYWSNNRFSGELPLDGLPKSMKSLTLEKNNLTGSIAMARLPSKLERVNLANNAFSGEFRLMELPIYLEEIIICGSAIERAVIVGSSKYMFFSLRHDSITEVVDETGRRHRWAEKIIRESRPYPTVPT